MSRTTKPCPGCGAVESSRKADAVCRDCAALLQLGREARDLARRRALGEGGMRAYLVADPGWSHFYPYIYLGQGGAAGERSNDAFRHAFDRLVTALATPLPPRSAPRGEWRDHQYRPHEREPEALVTAPRDSSVSQRVAVLLPEAAGEALRDLYAAADAIAREAHECGKRAGRGLLLGLATGEVSVADFNKATVDAT